MTRLLLLSLLLTSCTVGYAADQRPVDDCRTAVPTKDGYCPDVRQRLSIVDGCAVICRCAGGNGSAL